ncbi:dehydrogenase of unknown specificity, short-chain alcohol dehydrogenase like protein [Desulfosporosinus orientis DSM 765]|uniref:Ketoreductase domain-containing protein n=1 Tax=Desulfosporosinus orientis (strain ATCC 19365 / DSM 765 / NCIMB 8382 / VKM B-1628 / Singapore I) TaxID=768706 RepID=G7WCX7_DESOD|nr:SDR family oxidoreductase [Desulfosporosinus orientis]AET66883.1 dehydrogenase of unknown specificity, short-chain alcohol dehydrogenase like protein [Desulfosporosinus orientis DSM 765]
MSENGQVVVITGASRGIGFGIAKRFKEGGAKLALLATCVDPLREWSKDMRSDILLIECNITRKKEVFAARDQVLAHFGKIDVLVNNAGIFGPSVPVEQVEEDIWRQVLDVNLTGAFFCTQAFGSEMLDHGGSIINVSSIAGVVPTPFRGAYSSSKAGIMMLTQQTALEWGPRKVRTNAVCPGLIETDMTAQFYNVPGVREDREALVPMGRIGLPEDIAKVVCFLASPDAEYMNGEFLRVDGGFTITPSLKLY